MEASIYINILEDYIPNEFLENLFNELSSDSPSNEEEVTISLSNFFTTFTGYGHWRITCELVINGEKLVISRTTTNSEAISCANRDCDDSEKAQGYQSLITECISCNSSEVLQFIEQQAN